MSHLNRRAAVAGKVEAVAGTPETISFATDAIRVIGAGEPQIAPMAANSRADHQTGSVQERKDAEPAGFVMRVPLVWAPIGAGAVYSATVLPEDDVLRRVAGRSAAIVTTASAEKVTYSPVDDPTTTGTFKVRISGKEYTMAGAVMESMVTRCTPGGFPVCEGTLVGVFVSVSETALGTVTWDDVLQPLWKKQASNPSLSIGVYEPDAQSIAFDEGLAAEANVSNRAEDGLLFFKITRIRPVVTISGRIPALSTWAPLTAWQAKTSFALDVAFGLHRGQYFRMKFDADAACYQDVQDVTEGAFRNYSVAIHCAPHASAPANWIFD